MDDYHKFYDAHEANIEEWHRNWSPNYFSITESQLAMLTPTPPTIITRVSASLSTPRGSGNGLTIRAWALLAFNLIIEFFEKLCTNY